MQTLKALLVEDDADDAELLARKIKEAGYILEWTRVETERDFLGFPAHAPRHHFLGLFDSPIRGPSRSGSAAIDRSGCAADTGVRDGRRGGRRRSHAIRRYGLSPEGPHRSIGHRGQASALRYAVARGTASDSRGAAKQRSAPSLDSRSHDGLHHGRHSGVHRRGNQQAGTRNAGGRFIGRRSDQTVRRIHHARLPSSVPGRTAPRACGQERTPGIRGLGASRAVDGGSRHRPGRCSTPPLAWRP